jgi:hypothetical protein
LIGNKLSNRFQKEFGWTRVGGLYSASLRDRLAMVVENQRFDAGTANID